MNDFFKILKKIYKTLFTVFMFFVVIAIYIALVTIPFFICCSLFKVSSFGIILGFVITFTVSFPIVTTIFLKILKIKVY